ncbi:MAG TPA: DNA polymerase IV, partial [Candidatus Angelobacter sp.]|nr:DNA polymerase IV [Candidatus Angelobacter sp.]
EMASIDEAYLDMTGTERLHGPPLLSAHKLHQQMKERTGLNCSIGIGRTRLMSKISSDKAKPNGILFVLPGQEQSFLAPLDVGKIPGVGKVTKARLNQIGIMQIGDLLKVDEKMLEENFGKWGTGLAGKARGEDAGGWFEGEVGEDWQAKSISHEHTFNQDTAELAKLESTLAHLSAKACRRLREQNFSARTIQLKLRYSDFSTITRAQSLANPTQADTEVFAAIMELFHANWQRGRPIRLLGVHTGNFESTAEQPAQMDLLEGDRRQKWARALSATDRMRDKYGDSAIFLAKAMGGTFRERVQENPAERPDKKK